MAVLSIDLAYRRWSDLGIVVLDRPRPDAPIRCEILAWNYTGFETSTNTEASNGRNRVDANILAGRLNHLCATRDIRMILLDGPQAWKSGHNGLLHARVSERQLNTTAKTGLPGIVKPITCRPFAEFCLDVYEGLCRRGWRRLDTEDKPGVMPKRILAESYPHAAWKSLGLKPLPSKRRAKICDLAEAYRTLRAAVPFTTNRPPNHDQLQAIVGGLAGLALEEHRYNGARIVGHPPRREEGHWREGFILLPVRPDACSNLRWLQ
jgi:hypothetical protein